jgi:hypothetical protein
MVRVGHVWRARRQTVRAPSRSVAPLRRLAERYTSPRGLGLLDRAELEHAARVNAGSNRPIPGTVPKEPVEPRGAMGSCRSSLHFFSRSELLYWHVSHPRLLPERAGRRCKKQDTPRTTQGGPVTCASAREDRAEPAKATYRAISEGEARHATCCRVSQPRTVRVPAVRHEEDGESFGSRIRRHTVALRDTETAYGGPADRLDNETGPCAKGTHAPLERSFERVNRALHLRTSCRPQ